ncbi:MAG: LLM class F420-dependent oxidoreductase [Candidatus Rokuibacteriota bacterium]
MKFGVTMFPTDYAIDPITLARAVEERGFDSLFFPEHTHIPASRRTPWPGGADLPQEYWHTHDPFVALAAAAAVTRRIRLGTGICLVVERDPIQLAKEVASLDTISGGRFVFGIGAGWNAEEMENHGVSFARRWAIVREKVLAMKTIWSEDAPEFHGEFVDFDPIWSWPKPVQSKGESVGPPIWLGAQSKWAFDRVVEYCDGWMPIGLLGGLEEGMASLRRAAARAGREFDALDKAVFTAQPTPEACEKSLALGFGELIFALPSKREDEILPLLDRFAEVSRKLR